ncbi:MULTISPECIES: hypothetical protein [Delftia]|jgi:hypothetical protein|uniref:Uncharacterized protein n=1 Tax=Delftia lacustris TaxID=558537 RepID=A0A7T3DD25_9BURK|nr:MULTISPECIES: hypothetical protein [Delftia]QPS79849.1 hypothetical protein I6G47_22940 [Delftia lacustris]
MATTARISGPVGRAAMNHPKDVFTVQQLLNGHMQRDPCRKLLKALSTCTTACVATVLSACSNPEEYTPTGQWEATEDLYVYTTNDHPLTIAFTIKKGEICAISKKPTIRKDLGYLQVLCAQGSGWEITGKFKRLGNQDDSHESLSKNKTTIYATLTIS